MPADAIPAISRGTIPLYHAVQVGKTMLWVAADLIAFHVLSVVEQMPPADITMVLAGGLVWRGLSDVAVGLWLERRTGGRRILALVVGIAVPVAAIAFVAALLLSVAAMTIWPGPASLFGFGLARRTVRALSASRRCWRRQDLSSRSSWRVRSTDS